MAAVAHQPLPFQTHSPHSISPSSQSSPISHQYNAAMYGAYYQSQQAYNPYPQTHRFSYSPPTFPFSSSYQHPSTGRQNSIGQSSVADNNGSGNGCGRMPLSRQNSNFSGLPMVQTPILTNNGYPRRSSSATRSGTQTGPIKASGPVVVTRDSEGVPWITVEYTKDRVIKSHPIRIDVESVDVDTLPEDWKAKHVVYPAVFKGQRHQREKYENECNRTGWALTKLNPVLESSKGLRQRAVDHWRNSNPDRTKASRRVRRDAKKARRQSQTHQLRTQSEVLDREESIGSGLGIQTPFDSDMPMTLSRQYSSQSIGGYVSSSTASHQSHSTYANLLSNEKRHGRSFGSPLNTSNATLPPTPDTMNDARSESSHTSNHGVTGSYVPHDAHAQFNRTPVQAHHTPIDGRDQHFRLNLDIEGTRGHFPTSSHERACVFPRAIKTSRGTAAYDLGTDVTKTRTNVRLEMGHAFDEVMTIPSPSDVQHQRDGYWNDRADDLVRTQCPELRSRPQTIQQTLTRVHRKGGNHYLSSDSEVWMTVANRPGIYA